MSYDTATVGELVSLDTDGDGVPDWEENLWGTDPNKKDTIPGIPDSVTIDKMKAQQTASAVGQTTGDNQDTENLTQTDKFSQEFLTTVSTLEQNGAIDENGNMDQATIDKLSDSMVDSVQNYPQRKIYALSDLKIINNESLKATQKYGATLSGLAPKNSSKYSIIDVLQKFVGDGNTADPTVLPELDPSIQGLTDTINGMVKMEVPQSLSVAHLAVINAMEGVVENLNDIKKYDTDTIVAFSGIDKYDQDSTTLESASLELSNEIVKELNVQ